MSNIDRNEKEARDARIAFELLPVREQVLDRLADVMLETDDIVDALASESAGDLRSLSGDVKDLFDRANRLMARISD